MAGAVQISWPRLIALSQWERVLLALTGTCLMPLALHALPMGIGPEAGARWLPMFYAPLIAALVWRGHVALLVSLLAPPINHAFFGMPADPLWQFLTLQLVVFSTLVSLLSGRGLWRGWYVVVVYAMSLSIAVMVMGQGVSLADSFGTRMVAAVPGLLILLIISQAMGHRAKGQA